MTEPLDQTPPPPPPPRPRGRRARRIVLGVLAVLVLGVLSLALWTSWAMGGTSTGSQVNVEVARGESTSSIATKLESAGVVRSAFAFRLAARFRGVAADLKPGVYAMRRGLGVSEAIDVLREGVVEEVIRFTVPEGLTVIETARTVARQTHVTEEEFMEALADATVPASVRGEPPRRMPLRFEGLLFPNTYEVFRRATAADMVRVMLGQFEREIARLDMSKAKRFGLSVYEVVNLASLIEKEARLDEERRLVSSVIHNRLQRNMRLAIDATIQYEYIQRTGRVKNPLTFADYRLDWPHNTYRIDGLPPTPIAAPSRASLEAALDPADTEFLYYRLCTADDYGEGHVFGRTLAERDRKWRDDPRCGG